MHWRVEHNFFSCCYFILFYFHFLFCVSPSENAFWRRDGVLRKWKVSSITLNLVPFLSFHDSFFNLHKCGTRTSTYCNIPNSTFILWIFFFFWLMLFPLRGRFGIHLAFGKIIFKVQLEPPPNVWPVRVALSFTCGLITSSSATFSTKTNLKASDSLGEVEQSAFRTSDETLADESALRRRDVQFHIFVNMLAVNVKKKSAKTGSDWMHFGPLSIAFRLKF